MIHKKITQLILIAALLASEIVCGQHDMLPRGSNINISADHGSSISIGDPLTLPLTGVIVACTCVIFALNCRGSSATAPKNQSAVPTRNLLPSEFAIRQDISLYKQFKRWGDSRNNTSISAESRCKEYINSLFQSYGGAFSNLNHEDNVSWLTKMIYQVAPNHVYNYQAPEIRGNYSSEINGSDRCSASMRDLSTAILLCNAIKKNFKLSDDTIHEIQEKLIHHCNAVIYYNCMYAINENFKIDNWTINPAGPVTSSAQWLNGENKNFKAFCAQKHLEFFNIKLPKTPESIEKDYKNAKRYKEWHETSWWPCIFWFRYKKPNIEEFNKLHMLYRYVKYTPWVRTD